MTASGPDVLPFLVPGPDVPLPPPPPAGDPEPERVGGILRRIWGNRAARPTATWLVRFAREARSLLTPFPAEAALDLFAHRQRPRYDRGADDFELLRRLFTDSGVSDVHAIAPRHVAQFLIESAAARQWSPEQLRDSRARIFELFWWLERQRLILFNPAAYVMGLPRSAERQEDDGK